MRFYMKSWKCHRGFIILPSMFRHTKTLENFHIPLWLLKDTCWMLGLKTPAIIMILPTLTLAFMLSYRSRHHKPSFMPSLAVCLWISANSVWMLGEFYHFDFRIPALFLFLCGMFIIGLFFFQALV